MCSTCTSISFRPADRELRRRWWWWNVLSCSCGTCWLYSGGFAARLVITPSHYLCYVSCSVINVFTCLCHCVWNFQTKIFIPESSEVEAPILRGFFNVLLCKACHHEGACCPSESMTADKGYQYTLCTGPSACRCSITTQSLLFMPVVKEQEAAAVFCWW